MKINVKKINNYNIEYIDASSNLKKSIVFVHGLGGSLEQWRDQISYFSKEYRVIAFSLQGHGQSSKPVDDHNYSLNQYANTAIALLKELKVSNCTWVGNSMGGVIGYEVLSIDSSLINLLVTNGTTPELLFSNLGVGFVKLVDKLLMRILKFEGYIKFITKHTSKIKTVQDQLYNIMKNVAPHAVIASRQALGNYSYLNTIETCNTPIVVIKAPQDKDINKSLQKHNKRLNDCNNIKIMKLEDAGHVANLDKPQEYNELIDKILN